MTDEAETEEKPKRPRGRPSGRRLLARDWLEIVQMARSGVPVNNIAKSFKVAVSTVYVGLKKRRVTIGAYTTPAAEFEESQERKELLKRVRETKENDYKYTEFIQRRSIKLLMDAEKDGRAPGTAIDDLKALKAAMDVVRAGTDNKWRILGLDKDNADVDKELTELPIREMTEAEIVAERDKQLLDDTTLEGLEDLQDEMEEGEEEYEDEGDDDEETA
jgi:predicted DNA-binding protein YlxM (UPF0122 family)